ncbi:MAG TPA: hypothetical protein VGR21_11060 [Cryptosporangiaceae bacterium]|nr:hypothetical protein [Cryptosporangiaceae bacterium]
MSARGPGGGEHKPPLLLRGWVFFLVTALAVLVGVAFYSRSRPTVYTASAVVAFTPKRERPVTAAVVTLTAPRYVAFTASPYAVRQAAAAVGVPINELQDGLIVTMAAATANVTISVTLPDREEAAKAANVLAKLVLARAARDAILTGVPIADAQAPRDPSGPSQDMTLAGGFLAALCAGAVAAFLVSRYTRRRYALVARGVAVVGSPQAAYAPGSAAGLPSGLGDQTVVLRRLPADVGSDGLRRHPATDGPRREVGTDGPRREVGSDGPRRRRRADSH